MIEKKGGESALLRAEFFSRAASQTGDAVFLVRLILKISIHCARRRKEVDGGSVSSGVVVVI